MRLGKADCSSQERRRRRSVLRLALSIAISGCITASATAQTELPRLPSKHVASNSPLALPAASNRAPGMPMQRESTAAAQGVNRNSRLIGMLGFKTLSASESSRQQPTRLPAQATSLPTNVRSAAGVIAASAAGDVSSTGASTGAYTTNFSDASSEVISIVHQTAKSDGATDESLIDLDLPALLPPSVPPLPSSDSVPKPINSGAKSPRRSPEIVRHESAQSVGLLPAGQDRGKSSRKSTSLPPTRAAEELTLPQLLGATAPVVGEPTSAVDSTDVPSLNLLKMPKSGPATAVSSRKKHAGRTPQLARPSTGMRVQVEGEPVAQAVPEENSVSSPLLANSPARDQSVRSSLSDDTDAIAIKTSDKPDTAALTAAQTSSRRSARNHALTPVTSLDAPVTPVDEPVAVTTASARPMSFENFIGQQATLHPAQAVASEQATLVRNDWTVVGIAVENAAVCQAFQADPNTVSILGLQPGTTRVAIATKAADGEKQIHVHTMTVKPHGATLSSKADVARAINESIGKLFPGNSIDVTPTENGFVVTGHANTEAEAKRILVFVRKTTLAPVTDKLAAGLR